MALYDPGRDENLHLVNKGMSESMHNGFIIPEGNYTRGLVEKSEAVIEIIIDEISQLARKGNRAGLDELENLIKANCSTPANCRFYKPGMQSNPASDPRQIIDTLVGYATSDGLLEHSYEVQSCLSFLSVKKKIYIAIRAIENAADWFEVRAFQLLFAQLTINVKYTAARNVGLGE